MPFEVLYAEKEDYSKFKIFRCQNVPLCSKTYKKMKFNGNSLQGIFLVYDDVKSNCIHHI